MSNEHEFQTGPQIPGTPKTLSIVVPVYNEAEVLRKFHTRLSVVLKKLDVETEILYINDGSKDGSLSIIRQLSREDARVALIDLSRNFGKEVALTAGLDHSMGDAVVVIDADLQDPPELIETLFSTLKEGYDTVYAQRTSRKGESFLKKFTAAGFYSFMQHVGTAAIPQDTGDFRILSRRSVNALKLLREHHRFMKGLFTWIGYPQKAIQYDRDPRSAGTTKFNFWKLWNFAIEGITSYTAAPLKFATYFGFTVAIGAFLYAGFTIIKKLVFNDPVPGYSSLMVVILFLGGVQLIFIGFIGEYLGRTYNETKHRPLYFVNEYSPKRVKAQKKNSQETESER